MNPELRVNPNKQMYVVWYDFEFNKFCLKFVAHLVNNLFQTFINTRVKNLPSVLRTPHNVIVTLVNHVSVGLVAMRFS